MRDAATVHVDRAILHVLDHRKGEGGPVYSDIELDLEASSEVREYFEEQIDNTRADGATADARFLSRDAGGDRR